MTGLNPERDSILEIAAVVTGPDLTPLTAISRVVFQPDHVLEAMSGRVRDIHSENGLLDEVRQSGIEIRIAESEVLRAISAHVQPGMGLLCGRSVHHDWKFLVRHMPRLEQHLHFLRVDVSTFGVLIDAWFPDVQYVPPSAPHRAMMDVMAGLEEMRYYCKHALQVDVDRLARRHLKMSLGGAHAPSAGSVTELGEVDAGIDEGTSAPTKATHDTEPS